MITCGEIDRDHYRSEATVDLAAADQTRCASVDHVSELFVEHGHQLCRYLRIRCGSPELAEEILSETFVAALRQSQIGRAHELTSPWLYTVANRRLIDHWRRSAVQQRHLLLLEPDMVPDLTDEPDFDNTVQVALRQLSDRQRAALVLKYLCDQTTASVAGSMNLSYSATESLLARARTSFSTHYVACSSISST